MIENLMWLYCAITVFILLSFCHHLERQPASVAQLDSRPTGDQEVAGLTPARLATFFHGD